jgi:hypothetical protein
MKGQSQILQYTWNFGQNVLLERYPHLGVELMEIKPSMSF